MIDISPGYQGSAGGYKWSSPWPPPPIMCSHSTGFLCRSHTESFTWIKSQAFWHLLWPWTYSSVSREGISLPTPTRPWRIKSHIMSSQKPCLSHRLWCMSFLSVLIVCTVYNCPDSIAWHPRSNTANIFWELTMCQALLMQKWNIIHVFKGFKVCQQTSRPTNTPDYR